MTKGVVLSTIGFLFLLRFLIYYILGDGAGHIQSVVFGGTMVVIGVQIITMSFIADLLSVNRKLLENIKQLTFETLLLNKKNDRK